MSVIVENRYEKFREHSQFFFELQEAVAGLGALAHIHNETEIVFIVEGCAQIALNQNIFIANPGDMYITPPNYIHSILYLAPTSKAYCLKFNLDFIYSPPAQELPLKDIFPLLSPNDLFFKAENIGKTSIPNLLAHIYEENTKKNYQHLYSIKLYIETIMLEIIKYWNNYLPTLFSGYSYSKNKKKPHKITSYMWDNYFQSDMTANSVAKALFISYSYLAQIVKTSTGMSFTKYLSFIRVFYAKQFLLETDLSVTEIAFKVGFSSISYFNSSFKEFENISPTMYRKLHKPVDSSDKE